MRILPAATSDRAGRRAARRRARARRGLTLLEMTVVLMVIGLLAAAGLPRFGAFVAAEREAAAARQVRAELLQLGELARSRAEPIGLRPAAGGQALEVVRWEPPERPGDSARLEVLGRIAWRAAPVRVAPQSCGLMPAQLAPDPASEEASRWRGAIWWAPSGVSGGGTVHLPAPAGGGQWDLVIPPFSAAVRIGSGAAPGPRAR